MRETGKGNVVTDRHDVTTRFNHGHFPPFTVPHSLSLSLSLSLSFSLSFSPVLFLLVACLHRCDIAGVRRGELRTHDTGGEEGASPDEHKGSIHRTPQQQLTWEEEGEYKPILVYDRSTGPHSSFGRRVRVRVCVCVCVCVCVRTLTSSSYPIWYGG